MENILKWQAQLYQQEIAGYKKELASVQLLGPRRKDEDGTKDGSVFSTL